MVIADTSGGTNQNDQTTTIVPRPSSRSGGRNPREPVLEVKQKTSSKHEKRTRRDFYRYSGDDKNAPIEYVYTYSEETPRDSNGPADTTHTNGTTSTELVPVNGNGAAGKIECTVGDDGNLVVKIRGKPDKVPLDPRNLPVTLPDGWELREIQTNQRSRRTERSRKLRIKDEQVIEEQRSGAITVFDDQTVVVNGTGVHNGTSGVDEEYEYGHADDEEYEQGHRNGVAYVSKKTKKFTQGAAGLTSKMEELRTEEGVNVDHPDHQQRYSRNLRSVSERTESSRRKFTKQSVTDEKVTETHKSQVMYFDGETATATTAATSERRNGHRVDAHSKFYDHHSDVQRRDGNRQENGIIVESPDDSPYNSLDRKHRTEDVEIINVEDKYRYHPDDKPTGSGRRAGKTTTFENRRGYYTEREPPEPEYYDSGEDIQTDHRQFKCSYPPNPDHLKDGEGATNGETELRRDHKGNLVEKVEKVTEEDYYRVQPGKGRVDSRQSDFDSEFTERTEKRKDLLEAQYQKSQPDQRHDRLDTTERTDVAEHWYQSQPARKESDYDSVYNEETRQETTDYYQTPKPYRTDRPNGIRRAHTEDIEKTVSEDYYRIHPELHSAVSTDERTEEVTRVGTNLTPSRSAQKSTTEENIEKTTVEDRYRFPPTQITTEEKSATTDVKQSVFPRYRQPEEKVEENIETTNIEEYYRVAPSQRKPASTRTDEEQSETRTIIQTDLAPYPSEQKKAFQQNTEETNVEEYYRVRPVSKKSHTTETRDERIERVDTVKSPFIPSTKQKRDHTEETIEKSITEDYYRILPRVDNRQVATETREETVEVRNLSSQAENRKEARQAVVPRESIVENTERTDIEEYHRVRVPPRPVSQTQEVIKETVEENYYDTPLPYTVEKTSQTTRREDYSTRNTMVGTDINVDATADGKSPTPSQERKSRHERVTIDDRYRVVGPQDHSADQQTTEWQSERTTVKERIIPVGVTGADTTHGQSSRSSSVDLSDIKPGEHLLDNRILRDRGNLAQGGSMGLRRPPSRNPVKHHFGDENAPDDVLSTSDITLPTNMTQSHFTRQQTQTHANKTRTASVKQQQMTRDQQVLVNYVDTSRKPDWVHNIDQHFSGETHLHYVRPSAKSPTPRIEEIVTVPSGSTLITVNGEQEPVHGIVTEPTDRPFPVAVTDEETLVHQSDKAARTGFTRVTDTKGYKKSASEKVTYQETRENQRQITISYDVPGVGKETREYTWQGAQQQPSEKITFEETRERLHDVSLTLGMAHQARTTTETTVREDKFVFDEIREAPRRDVSVKLAIDTQQDVVTSRAPLPAYKFHFEEEIKREHDVNFVIGLQQEQERHKRTAERTEIYERKEVREDIYRQPVDKMMFREDREITRDVSLTLGMQPLPVAQAEKVTFHEDREVTRDVSLTLGIEPLPPVEPIPIEKITFEETRVVPAELPVAVTFGLEEPLIKAPSPRPVSVISDSTIITPEIVPRYSRTVEDVKTTEEVRRTVLEPVPEYSQHYEEDTRLEELREIITPSPAPLREETVTTRVREDVRQIEQYRRQPIEPVPEYTQQYAEDLRVDEYRQFITPSPAPLREETVTQVREDVRVMQQVVQHTRPMPDDHYHYEEDVRVEEMKRVVLPPPQRPIFTREDMRRVDVLERIVEVRESPPKITADVEIQTPTFLEAKTEVVPPLPRRTSLTTAIDATEAHHTEVDLVPIPKRIYETTVDYTPHEKRERVEEHVEVKGPPPAKLPPTSGRVEKHVNLETIVPEPTGQPLPHSLGTYGYVYQATLDAKTPEREKAIDFHIIETPTEVREELVEKIDWYVREGAVVEEISESESSFGEPRAVSPPRHPELTANTEIITPTRVTAAVEVSPPKEVRPVKKPPVVPTHADVTPRYYFGEDEEERLSVQETVEKKVTKPKKETVTTTQVRDEHVRSRVEDKKRVESTEKVVLPPPPPLKNQISEMIRKIIAEAVPTHHTELGLTAEEEERWKSSYQRTPLRRPQRAEAKLQLKKPPIPPVRPPPVSGRIPKLTGSEKVTPEPTGKPLPKSVATYGFLYIATLEPKLLPPTQSIVIQEAYETSQIVRETELNYIELDVQQVLLAAFSEIQPPLTITQQEQLLTATAEVFPPLTEGQQQSLLNAMVEIVPPLTPQQQYQLLTGAEEVVPALTREQHVQLSIATAEIVPTFTVEQQRQVVRASVEIVPPLAPEQQRQLLSAIAEVFPAQRAVKDIELEFPQPPQPTLPTPSWRIPRKTWSGKLELAPTGQTLPKELGTYGFLYVTHVQPAKPAREQPGQPIEVTIKSIDLDVQQVLLSAVSHIQPALTMEQEQQLITTASEVFPPLTVTQQRRLLDVLTEIRPPLTVRQQEQLFLDEEIHPPLTPGQQRQLMIASAEIITITEHQEKMLLRASTRIVPPLSPEQQLQLLNSLEEFFPPPERVEQLIQELTATAYQPKALGTFGFLYITHVKPDEAAEFQSLDINLRDVDITSIELDVEHAMLAAFADIQPPLTHKQQHQLLIASRDIFPRLTEQQQRRILNVLVQLLPPMTVRQQRQLLTGSDLIIPPLTTRQQQQLLTASSDIFTLTSRLEKQLIYAMTQVSPPLTSEQQRQLLFALREIFPASKKSQTEAMIERFEQSTHGSRMSRLEEHETYGRINERGIWERTSSEQRKDRVYRDASQFDVPDHPRRPGDYEGPHPEWLDETRHLQVGTQGERHIGHGGILKEKDVILPDEKKWLAEQHLAIDEEFMDLEVSAISMNVKPRIKSQMYMAPSPPTARTFSPATGGFQYSASPQQPSPPLTEYSGFVYEAQVDGHGSPMSAEMGTYGFTYHATLDGSEIHKRHDGHGGPLEMYAESRKRSPPESVKTMSATPPWSTPPVTPTPVMATPGGYSRETTPMSAVRELPEPSRDSPWKKPGSPDKLRSSMERDILQNKQYPEKIFTLKKDERQEVAGQVLSPEAEVYERITETTARIRQEREIVETQGGSMFRDVSGRRRGSDESGVFREFEEAANELERELSTRPLSREARYRPIGMETETTVTQKSSESQRSYSEASQEGRRRVTSVAAPHRTVPAYTAEPEDDKPEWVRIAEERKKSTMYARDVPVKRHLGNLPEETPLEAALERAIEKNNQRRRTAADTSPLRKWDTLQLSAAALGHSEETEGMKSYKRHATETKETIEESRFHSDQAMKESGTSAVQSNLEAYASMSQSLPSLSGSRRGGSAAYGQLKRKNLGDAVSLEELEKTSRTLRRTDGAEEETRDTSFARRGDAVSPETKRTKRTVVRKLIDGQWREVAVREEDIPVEGDILMQIEDSPDKILEKFKGRADDDTWSLSDAIIEETTTTRTVRRVEEEEEDIVSLADSERSALQ
ncbi:uncharacterized protein LOC129581471 isoform X3 [Paramacrobiotus metropolitanus]|uniref:uncharacterized protein LOC129581471 isoform X3 n=1 Tax=Paramacrobiotus metropolitanus TaxID=2943436 RepID=UPI002445B964|nr:uncharacterized protein LOC129581471 isoform X3 [Paramacrobiotus metropolitanus]